jgi:hypothetical protein
MREALCSVNQVGDRFGVVAVERAANCSSGNRWQKGKKEIGMEEAGNV